MSKRYLLLGLALLSLMSAALAAYSWTPRVDPSSVPVNVSR